MKTPSKTLSYLPSYHLNVLSRRCAHISSTNKSINWVTDRKAHGRWKARCGANRWRS